MGAHIENPSSAARPNITQENLGIFKAKFETELPTFFELQCRTPCTRDNISKNRNTPFCFWVTERKTVKRVTNRHNVV
jgi:hypothetical protein